MRESGTIRARARELVVGDDAETRTQLADHLAAIETLQREVADLREQLDRSADEQRRAVREAVDDLAQRLNALTARLDSIEQ